MYDGFTIGAVLAVHPGADGAEECYGREPVLGYGYRRTWFRK